MNSSILERFGTPAPASGAASDGPMAGRRTAAAPQFELRLNFAMVTCTLGPERPPWRGNRSGLPRLPITPGAWPVTRPVRRGAAKCHRHPGGLLARESRPTIGEV